MAGTGRVGRAPRRAVVAALAVGLVAAACSDSSPRSAVPRPTGRPAVVDSQGGAGSGQDSPKPPVLPRSRFDHSLTALPKPATVGGAWSFLGPKPIASLKSYVT